MVIEVAINFDYREEMMDASVSRDRARNNAAKEQIRIERVAAQILVMSREREFASKLSACPLLAID
jgi:hypothetical protein